MEKVCADARGARSAPSDDQPALAVGNGDLHLGAVEGVGLDAACDFAGVRSRDARTQNVILVRARLSAKSGVAIWSN